MDCKNQRDVLGFLFFSFFLALVELFLFFGLCRFSRQSFCVGEGIVCIILREEVERGDGGR